MVRKWGALIVLVSFLGGVPAYAAPEEPSLLSGSAEVAAPAHDADGGSMEAPHGAVADTAPAAPAAAVDVQGKGAFSDVDRINAKYLKGYITDTGDILSSPLHWNGADWAKAGAVLGITGGLFFADTAVRDFSQKNKGSIADGFATVGNDFGDPLYAPAAVGSFYLYGLFKDDPKARRAALLALESYSISSLFTSGIKNLVGRHRPETGDAPGTLDGPTWNVKHASFSSGHTSNAFAIATIFANEYQDNNYVPPIAYGLATLTGLSRIYDNKHWASDVFFGGALGYFTSKAILAFHKKDEESRITITPQVSKEMMGLTVGYKF